MIKLGDKRYLLWKLLQSYFPADEQEERKRLEIIDFIERNPDCFERNLAEGHITGSVLVINDDYTHALLTHYAILDLWLQFGGHSDGDPNILNVALREAVEESGLTSLRFISDKIGIFDVDIHEIPHDSTLDFNHKHHDIRFLLVADDKEKFTITRESKDLKWIKLEDAGNYNSQQAFLRMIGKVNHLKR